MPASSLRADPPGLDRGRVAPDHPTTVEDVARMAGVSRQTVSRVLNEHPHVAVATRARVQAAMTVLAWAPDPAAQALGRRNSPRPDLPCDVPGDPGCSAPSSRTPVVAAGSVPAGVAAALYAAGFRLREVPASTSPEVLAHLLAQDQGPGVVVVLV